MLQATLIPQILGVLFLLSDSPSLCELVVVSGLWMCGLWILRIQPAPKVDAGLIKQLLPVALAHTVGHVTACVSFSMMAVSFAHIVKSAEPVFAVALSGPFLGTWAPYYVWLSLLPIVAGCSLSAMKELSFAWGGFNFAMASNLGMVMRNILSKKCLTDVKVCCLQCSSGTPHTLLHPRFASILLSDIRRCYLVRECRTGTLTASTFLPSCPLSPAVTASPWP